MPIKIKELLKDDSLSTTCQEIFLFLSNSYMAYRVEEIAERFEIIKEETQHHLRKLWR